MPESISVKAASRGSLLARALSRAHWLAPPLGGLLALSFGREHAAGLAVVALAAFAALLWHTPLPTAGARARRGALLGLGFGLGWFAAGIWWLYISMAVYGGMPALLAGAAVLLFSLYLALYPALACALAAALAAPDGRGAWPLARGLGAALALAGAWTLGEVLRGTVFTGFPWLAVGYSQVGGPLAGVAPLLGGYGVGFVTVLVAGLLALASQLSLRGTAVAVALLLGVALGAARVGELRWTHADGAPLRVALLQGDVAQSQKFRPESLAPTLRLYGGWLDRLQADLILTPETALPVLPEELPPHYLDDLQRTLRSHGTDALVGIPLTRGADGYTNSVIGLGDARPYRYDKAHLVPFGEFIPYGFHWFVRLMNMPLGDFARGRLDQPSFEVRGRRIAPTICYEDLFGEQLAQRFAVPAQAPNVIANLTNLAWFGDTIALPQHLQIARMRSLEFQLPSIRATNTGVTAIIDARGRVTGQLAPYTAGVLLGSVQPAAGVTPYAWLAARLGYAPIVLLGLLALALAAAAARALPTIRD